MFCALIFDLIKAAVLISTTALPLLRCGSDTLKYADDSCFCVLISLKEKNRFNIQSPSGINERCAPLCLCHSPPPVAQKVVAMRKKQQLSIGPCKSLPNSPSHSSVPAASIPSVHINQV